MRINKKLIIGWVLIIVGCNSQDNKNVYREPFHKYFLKQDVSERNNCLDTLYTFYDYDDQSIVKMVGFIKDGFRNDEWTYNLKSGVKSIKWGYYKDKTLNFETNVFSYIDSIKHGGFVTKFLFKLKTESIIMNIVINGPLKDSIPEVNYKRIFERNCHDTGVIIESYETKKIINSNRNLYLSEISVKRKNDPARYIEDIYGFIDKDNYIDISVSSNLKQSFYNQELFNAVVTNFYLKGKRFFKP